MNLCLCGCGKETKNIFIRFHHNKFQKGKFGKDNPMFGKKQSEASNQKRRLKLFGIKKSPLKGLNYEQFYGVEKANEIRMKLLNRKSWNFGLTKHTNELLRKIALKISEGRMGDKNWNWKGGYSVKDYGRDFNEYLKRSVRERDGFECVNCKENKMILHVHHIDENKKNNEIGNLVTLCARCHRLLHTRKVNCG